MIGPEASAFGFAFRPSSSRSATSSTFSSSSSRFCLRLRRDLRELRVAAPVLGVEAFLRELALDAVDVRVGEVDLVHGDDDRHLGRACVRDRLLRLRHHAVVGGDDQDGDVRDFRAAGAHGGERLVARRVEEGDLAAVDVDLVRADVLRDPAGLGGDDARVADRVEQRRLAVVDVAHDRHDRRPRLQRLLGVVERLGLFLFVGGVLDRDLAADLGCDQLDLLVAQRLGRRAHLAEAHEDLDDVRHRHAERLREVADADAGLDRDRTGRRRRGWRAARGRWLSWRACRCSREGRAPPWSMTTRRRRPPPAAAAARAERTVRSVASVSHVSSPV